MEAPNTMLIETCGSWRTKGFTSSPGRTADEWVISNVMWEPVFGKIWTQSVNYLRPMLRDELLVNVDQRRALKITARRLRDGLGEEDPLACVINRLK